MFENKYLKQLQDVQVQIKGCKATIAELKPPSPDTLRIGMDIKGWLDALFRQHEPAIQDLIGGRKLNKESLDYLHKLGEYFIKVADYARAEQKCRTELELLRSREKSLKEKLGID